MLPPQQAPYPPVSLCGKWNLLGAEIMDHLRFLSRRSTYLSHEAVGIRSRHVEATRAWKIRQPSLVTTAINWKLVWRRSKSQFNFFYCFPMTCVVLCALAQLVRWSLRIVIGTQVFAVRLLNVLIFSFFSLVLVDFYLRFLSLVSC